MKINDLETAMETACARHPCIGCRLDKACRRGKIECKTFRMYLATGKIANYGDDRPTREEFNKIWHDYVPYNSVVHGL